MKFSCVYSISNAIGSYNSLERLRVLTILALVPTCILPRTLAFVSCLGVCVRACVGVRAGVPICLCVCMSVCGCTYVREDVCACTGAQKRQNRRPPQQMTRCGGSSDNERYTYSPALVGGESLGLPASQLCCASSPIESTPVYAASASVSVCQSSQPLCRFLAR